MLHLFFFGGSLSPLVLVALHTENGFSERYRKKNGACRLSRRTATEMTEMTLFLLKAGLTLLRGRLAFPCQDVFGTQGRAQHLGRKSCVTASLRAPHNANPLCLDRHTCALDGRVGDLGAEGKL